MGRQVRESIYQYQSRCVLCHGDIETKTGMHTLALFIYLK